MIATWLGDWSQILATAGYVLFGIVLSAVTFAWKTRARQDVVDAKLAEREKAHVDAHAAFSRQCDERHAQIRAEREEERRVAGELFRLSRDADGRLARIEGTIDLIADRLRVTRKSP